MDTGKLIAKKISIRRMSDTQLMFSFCNQDGVALVDRIVVLDVGETFTIGGELYIEIPITLETR